MVHILPLINGYDQVGVSHFVILESLLAHPSDTQSFKFEHGLHEINNP
jgi:hypothetical protein